MENKIIPVLCANKDCTGCMACVNSCGVSALSISTDNEGFYRPSLNEAKCVSCGMCEKSCPILNPPLKNKKEDLRVYAAWHKGDDIRMSSSSGGAFTALAEEVLQENGCVFGAAYVEDLQVAHIEVEQVDELEKLRLSKYAQSKIGTVMNQVRKRLIEGRNVMFVGTPCQVAGLKQFLRKDYENLVAVDFICHGVPSALFFSSWIQWLEKKYGHITRVNFRDKRKGWYDGLTVIHRSEGKEKVLKGLDSGYMTAFNCNNNLQNSCYTCKAQGFPRCSDLTIADFWRIGHSIPFGHKEEIEKGVSMIVINNPKKHCLLDRMKDKCFFEERTIDEAILGNMAAVRSNHKPESRDIFYKDLVDLDFDTFAKKYLRGTKKQRLLKIFREYVPFGIVKRIRLKKQK